MISSLDLESFAFPSLSLPTACAINSHQHSFVDRLFCLVVPFLIVCNIHYTHEPSPSHGYTVNTAPQPTTQPLPPLPTLPTLPSYPKPFKPSKSCQPNEWQCDNLECIDSRLYCNDIEDCADGSDEICLSNGNLFSNGYCNIFSIPPIIN